MLIICGAIFVLVFGVMFYSIWKHRKSKGAVAANWHENTMVEIVWTVIPFIIIILMALPATRTVVAMKDTSNADLTVKATGYQWQWGYDYIRGEGEGIAFLSRLATPRAQIEGNEPKTANYLSEVTEPLGRAGQSQDSHHHHRKRRDSCVGRACARCQAGRNSRLYARRLVSR